MNVPFWKYEGAGNDFVMIDQRETVWLQREDTARIARICHRHFGIGADGLILLQSKPGFDFEMIYFNADGRESSMCGNGGRCIAAFARQIGLSAPRFRFWAIDGEHEAVLATPLENNAWWVELKMQDVNRVEKQENDFILNTGSPHLVRYTSRLHTLDVQEIGSGIRNGPPFAPQGINVNFVEAGEEELEIRTYERGVEAETLACGTGVTAAALTYALRKGLPAGDHEIPVKAQGGRLRVRFTLDDTRGFRNVWLCGPATPVFTGLLF